MKTVFFSLLVTSALALPAAAGAEEKEHYYNSCEEVHYDATDDPCGGGHQEKPGKRDPGSLDLTRHRHRYFEEKIKALSERVSTLEKELEQLKKERR